MGYINLSGTASTQSYLDAPVPYARMYLYHPGGSRLAPIYGDEHLKGTRANPVKANADGVFDIGYAKNGTYEVVIKDRYGDTLLQETDFRVVPQQVQSTQTFSSVDALLNSTEHGYSGNSATLTVVPGQILQIAGSFTYTVAPATATDHHLETAGGLKLHVQSDGDGYYPVEAFGFKGDGTAEDRDRLQAAADATPYLKFHPKLYELGAYVTAPDGYGSHQYCCLIATQDIRWRSSGTTTLRISDQAQTGAATNDITLLFMEDFEHFSAPGFVLDENASALGFGGPLACYGVTNVHLDGVVVKNCNSLRLGSSATRLCGTVHGKLIIENSLGTFAVGGKPGGAERWENFQATVIGGNGGINLECEDIDQRGLTHVTSEATLGQITGFNIHSNNSPVEFVKIEDGLQNATVSGITLRNASSSATGRAAALSIKTGQIGAGPNNVQVGQIAAEACEEAIYVESGDTVIGSINVNSVQANETRSILTCTHGGSASLSIRSIMIGSAQGSIQSPSSPNSGTAFVVDMDDSEQALDPHLEYLGIGGGHLRSVRRGTFSVRGVKQLSCTRLTVDQHTIPSPSSGYAGTIYNVIEADDIILTDTILRGFAGSALPLELRPKKSCRLVGLEIEAGAGAGTALFLNGSGQVSIEGCRFAGASNALNFRVLKNDFDAATDVDTGTNSLTIPGHVFRHGEKVRYTHGTSAIGGLTHNSTYYVLYVDANTVQLSDTLRGSAVDLTGLGSGTASLEKTLDVRVTNTRNECTSLVANSFRAQSYEAVSTW